MRNIIKSLTISAMLVGSLSADYKLVLTDKEGNQTEECIKSYSFSNNLESIAMQKGVTQDVYSEEEVMTNKVYKGKPIYRKIVTIPANLIGDKTWRWAPYINPAKNIETLLYTRMVGVDHASISTWRNDDYQITYEFYHDTFGYNMGSQRVKGYANKEVIFEYTKTTDVADSSSTEFKSYLHYVPSASQTQDVTTKNMDELGVQLLKDYSYDSSTQSCVKNQ